MNKSNIDNIITQEAQKLIGYIMPILEAMSCQEEHKKAFKKCLWKFKDNLSEKLISEKLNDDTRQF